MAHAGKIDGDLIWQLHNGTFWYAGGKHSNCTLAVCPVALSVYGYRPSLPASSILIALYAICAAVQLFLGLRYKAWWFMGAMIAGCLDEILGYVGRIMYNHNPWAQTGFILQIVMITIGPVFFSAAIYVLLSQIILYLSVKHARFAPKWLYWTFIPSDILSLILQAIGGAMSSTSNGKSKNGVDIALAGLSIQVFTLTLFVILCIDYFIRSRSVWSGGQLTTRFKIFITFLMLATVLILVRCAYRIYELSEGYVQSSKALRDEKLFIGLESVMVIVSAYCLIIAHPGPAFSGSKSTGANGQHVDEEK